MSEFKWFKKQVPDDLKVTQVYGIVFSDDGRIILRIEDGKYQLTGGHPKDFEKYEETLQREYIEEVNISLKDIYYLGYLLVTEDSKEQYAQVRMIARINKIGEKRPDIDNGKIYDRKLVSLDKVKEYLNYDGIAGNAMIDDAINLAKQKYNFIEQSNEREKPKQIQNRVGEDNE